VTGDPLAGVSFTDVVIVPSDGGSVSRNAGALAGDPPVQLLPDLQLRRLSQSEVKQYTEACESKNLNFKAYGGDGQRYAFVRHPAPATPDSLHQFDPDRLLNTALSLSRYLVLNAHCTECAAPYDAQSERLHLALAGQALGRREIHRLADGRPHQEVARSRRSRFGLIRAVVAPDTAAAAVRRKMA
jgi:hypothetical protein